MKLGLKKSGQVLLEWPFKSRVSSKPWTSYTGPGPLNIRCPSFVLSDGCHAKRLLKFWVCDMAYGLMWLVFHSLTCLVSMLVRVWDVVKLLLVAHHTAVVQRRLVTQIRWQIGQTTARKIRQKITIKSIADASIRRAHIKSFHYLKANLFIISISFHVHWTCLVCCHSFPVAVCICVLTWRNDLKLSAKIGIMLKLKSTIVDYSLV